MAVSITIQDRPENALRGLGDANEKLRQKEAEIRDATKQQDDAVLAHSNAQAAEDEDAAKTIKFSAIKRRKALESERAAIANNIDGLELDYLKWQDEVNWLD